MWDYGKSPQGYDQKKIETRRLEGTIAEVNENNTEVFRILVFQNWYTNGNSRGENEQYDKQYLRNRIQDGL